MSLPIPTNPVKRPGSSPSAFFAAVAVVVVLFGDAALRGAWPLIGRWLPLALFILWFFWIALIRSSLRFTPAALMIVNLLRVHTVPWSRIAEVRSGPQLQVNLDDGRRITSFGSPPPPRRGKADDTRTDVAELVAEARDAAPASDAVATSTWDRPATLVGAVLFVAAVVCALLVR